MICCLFTWIYVVRKNRNGTADVGGGCGCVKKGIVSVIRLRTTAIEVFSQKNEIEN